MSQRQSRTNAFFWTFARNSVMKLPASNARVASTFVCTIRSRRTVMIRFAKKFYETTGKQFVIVRQALCRYLGCLSRWNSQERVFYREYLQTMCRCVTLVVPTMRMFAEHNRATSLDKSRIKRNETLALELAGMSHLFRVSDTNKMIK